MRIHAYCIRCGKVKRMDAPTTLMGSQVPIGVCEDCSTARKPRIIRRGDRHH